MKQNPSNGSILVHFQTANKGLVDLPRLRVSNIVRLKNRITEERRAALLRNAAETVGVNSPQVLNQLNEFDSRPVDRGAVIEWGLNPAGVVPVLAMAWAQTYSPAPDSEEEQDKYIKRAEAEVDQWDADWDDWINAVAGVLNVKLDRKKPEQTEEPQRPLTDGGRESQSASLIGTTPQTQSA